MSDLPSTHKAASIVRGDDYSYHFEPREIGLPELRPSDILLKVSRTGIFGYDFHLASGHLGLTQNILSHEGVGYVVKLGDAVTDVEIGDRIGIA